MPHSLSKKDDSVSSVIGTMMLLALVIVAGSIVAINVSSNISSSSEMGPITTLEVSADGKSIYNSGGDVLYRQNIYVYDNKGLVEDVYLIDERYILDNSAANYDWTEWKTGQAIRSGSPNVDSNSARNVDDLCVVYFEGGNGFVIFTGSSYIGVVPTVKPTKQPTPSPTIPAIKGPFKVTFYVEDHLIKTYGGEGEEGYYSTLEDSIKLYSRIAADPELKIYNNEWINGWFKANGDIWNPFTDRITEDISLYAKYQDYPYFRYGTSDENGDSYDNAGRFVAAVNKWKPGTILTNGDMYVICKDIPLEGQSLTFDFGDVHFGVIDTEYLITTPVSYGYPGGSAMIWASPSWKGSLIDIQDGTVTFTADESFNIVVDGCNRGMTDSLVKVRSGTTLFVDGNLEVKRGNYNTVLNSGSGNLGGAGIYNSGTIKADKLYANGNSVTIIINSYKKEFSNIGGGGIYNSGIINAGGINAGDNRVTIKNIVSYYRNEFSNIGGGGIYNSGTIDNINNVYNNDVSFYDNNNNFISFSSGNTFSYIGGGGIYNMEGSVKISGIIGSLTKPAVGYSNKAVSGGGIYNYGGEITLNTGGNVSYNLAETTSSGSNMGCGGGIFNTGTLEIHGSVNYNSADEDLGDNTDPSGYESMGGGIYNADSGGVCNINIDSGAKIIGNTAFSRGGGILNYHEYDASSGHIIIEDAEISGNTAAAGGGVYNYNSNGRIEIKSSTISNNVANYWSGGGIYIKGTLSISGTSDLPTKISGNTVKPGQNTQGGGGIAIDGGTVTLSGYVTISENIANVASYGYPITFDTNNNKGFGGGIYVKDGELRVSGPENKITNNIGRIGGGIYITKDHTVNIGYYDESGIYKSGKLSVDSNGEYIFETDSEVKLEIKTKDGGGIYNAGTFTVNDGSELTVNSNYATVSGGGIYNSGTITVDIAEISSNSIISSLSAGASNIGGGGIYNAGTFTVNNKLTVESNAFAFNLLNSKNKKYQYIGGGGVYNSGDLSGNIEIMNNVMSLSSKDSTGSTLNYIGGGGLFNAKDGADISGLFSGNIVENSITNTNIGITVANGGGIFNVADNVIVSGIVGVVGVVDGGNSALGGGGIYNSGSSMSVSGTVSGNTATDGGGIYNKNGGNVYLNYNSADSLKNSIYGNTATGRGGGIWSYTTDGWKQNGYHYWWGTMHHVYYGETDVSDLPDGSNVKAWFENSNLHSDDPNKASNGKNYYPGI